MGRARSLLLPLARPRVALPLLGLAALGWGLVVSAWLRELPVRRHLERGMEYARQGLGPQAEREWTAAVRQDRRCAPAFELLSEYYLSCQRWADAAVTLRKLAEAAPAEPHVSCRLASALLNARDEVGAYGAAEAELRRAPECVPALAIAAVMLSQVGEEQRRLGYLRRLARLRPDDVDLQFMLADALTDSYLYAEARPVLQRVLRAEPEHAEALTLVGAGWLNDRSAPDHLTRAASLLTRALALHPVNGRARLTLGRVYLEAGQPEKAIVQLEEAARLIPYSYRVPFELARAYDAAHRPGPAAAARRRFASLRQLASDETTLQKRCASNPDNFEDHYRLGLLQARLGDYRKAYYYLRRARDLRPNHPQLLAALRSLGDQTALPSRLAAVQSRTTGAPAPASPPSGGTP
jgi:tetratricopeptide (TPR) repeat protein